MEPNKVYNIEGTNLILVKTFIKRKITIWDNYSTFNQIKPSSNLVIEGIRSVDYIKLGDPTFIILGYIYNDLKVDFEIPNFDILKYLKENRIGIKKNEKLIIIKK